MKICIAQTRSIKADIQKNIKNHIRFVERAIKYKADLVIFPELSITNYEPCLAKELATDVNSAIFNPFQELSNASGITIGVGMPLNSKDGIYISLLFFQPNKESQVYSKQILHEDEKPYFICGGEQAILKIKGKNITFGICYETLQREHVLKAYQRGTDIYIASVAKPKQGVEKAYDHFSKIANEFSTPIVMANCVGSCDNFMSAGQSAVWNNKGDLIHQLDAKNQGVLVYDTRSDTAVSEQLLVEKAITSDLEVLFTIYQNAKLELDRKKIYQWTDTYPTKSIIKADIDKDILYVLKNPNKIVGAINISEEQEKEYQSIDWKFDNSKVLVIHRLVVHPNQQRKGYAKQLMDFAENFAVDNSYTSIRLDVYSQNKSVIDFYIKRGYVNRGEVYFSEREFAFYCMEKQIFAAT